MEDLSVSELAEHIAPGGDKETVQRITRQLRHWTVHHLLEPVGGLHTGPGRHRRYRRESVYVAALVSELANLGFPIGTLCSVATVVKFGFAKPAKGIGRKPSKLWRCAIEGEREVLLHFSPSFKDGGELELPLEIGLIDGTGGVDISSLGNTSHVIINLTKLFAPLRT